MKIAVSKNTFCENLPNDLLVFLCMETATGRDAKMYMPRCTVTGDENRNVPRAAYGTPLRRRCGEAERTFLGR